VGDELDELRETAADRAARDRIAAMPRCVLCGRPLTVGQHGTHYVCRGVAQQRLDES
jgi:hypothetical protein